MALPAYEYCIHLLVDGANERRMDELFRQGRLPNIARYLAEPGAKGSAITCFPSTTGPAFTPIMTGNFPGTCNIPGVRWFDRTLPANKKVTLKRFRDYFNWGIYAFDSDLSKNVKTIYEYVPESVSLLGLINRGTQLKQKAGFFKAPYLFHRAVNKNDVQTLDAQMLRYFEKSLVKNPKYIFYYFPIVDLFSHKYGMDSDPVTDAYVRMDRDIGEIARMLREKGILEKTLMILTSDHGHENVHTHLDTDAFVKSHFKNVLYFPGPYRGWKKAQAINLISGNSMTHIYVRAEKDWHGFHDFELLRETGLVDRLLEKNEIEFVMGRKENGWIGLKSQKGEANIRERNGKIEYEVVHSDPFGFAALPKNLTLQQALDQTAHTEYPDAILQVAQLFRSKRTGDLVCAAAKGCDLRAGHKERYEHRSSHGSLHREHMITPLYSNHPFKAHAKRSADIFATTLNALGIKPRHTLDGSSFL